MYNGKVTRIYYKNLFFHTGHIKTMLDNERFAKKHNGICYAIVDDRQDNGIKHIKDDFDYIGLKHIKVISVNAYYKDIMDYTRTLIKKGDIYLCRCNIVEYDPSVIMNYIKKPTQHFQLRLKCSLSDNDPSIGYTYEDKGKLRLTLIFDYIIKILDKLLGVTDIIITSSIDTCDVKDENIATFFDSTINHHRLDTYTIENFKYSKRGWNAIEEANPYLLTFKGLCARHIPSIVLKAFYMHACQMGKVNIKYLSTLLNTYLYMNSKKVYGIINPVKVIIDNWRDKQTEYICTSIRGVTEYHPMCGTFYVSNSDIGMDRLVNVGRHIYLNSNLNLLCTEIQHSEHCTPIIHTTDITNINTNTKYNRSINWISSSWDSDPCKVRFYLYNWFYTGYNELLKPDIIDGYIDHNVFSDVEQIYYIQGQGYFVYDRNLSVSNGIPTFLRICK